jgi:TolB-like protein
MKLPGLDKRKHIWKIMLTYAGGGWVIIQVVNLIISQYEWPVAFLDITILLFLFGLPAALMYALYGTVVSKKTKLIYALNIFLALSTIGYYFLKPDSLHPNQIKFMKFKGDQKKIAKAIESIAILPFSNLTGDSLNDYLSASIHDALTTELGAISSLRVISKTTMNAINNHGKTLQQIAEELNVDAIMEGSILFVNDLIRVNVSLMNVFPDEMQLWSKEYSESSATLINVYSKITKNLAEEIDLPLTSKEKLKLDKKRTVNPLAQEEYMRGRHYLSNLSLESVEQAESYFLNAIKVDPEYPEPYAGLSGVWVVYKQLEYKPHDSTQHKIDYYIDRSFQLDSMNAEVWRWHATNLAYKYNWKGCNKALEKSLELNPNFSENYAFYAHFLMMQNRWDEAWKNINKALELDPLNPLVLSFRKVMLLHNGDVIKGVDDQFKSALPDFKFLAHAYLKDYDLAIKELKTWIRGVYVEGMDELIDNSYADNGFETTLNKVAQELVELDDYQYIPSIIIISLYYNANNVEQTLFWLERMYIRKNPNLPYWAIKGPLMKEWLLKEPRYIELMKRINLY